MLLASTLHCHPASPCPAITVLRVSSCALADGGVRLRFQVEGEMNALRIPEPPEAQENVNSVDPPTDNLWQHTCFEAFISTAHTSAYREFNFSPNGQWAAYAFSDYRQRDTSWQPGIAPGIRLRNTAEGFDLEATIPAVLLPTTLLPVTLATPTTLHIGLAAVIETSGGTLSYWALTHPGERPDFHQRATFTLHLSCHPILHIDLS